MRIALLSDIHGNLPALTAVLEHARTRGVERFVNLGDSLSGPLMPLETARYLMAQDWVQLAGNHERQLLDFDFERRGLSDQHAHAQLTPDVFAWMKTLAHAQALDDEVFLCHGTPRSDLEYFLDTIEGARTRPATAAEIHQRLDLPLPRVIACGHTHIPRIARSASGQLLVNPGSVGLQAYGEDRPHYHVIENGSPDARYAIIEHVEQRWHAQLLQVRYDHVSMASLARERGRPDWEVALLTGRMAGV